MSAIRMIGMFHSSRSSTDVTPRPAYADVFGQPLRRVGGIEPPAGLLRDPPQRRSVHRRIEELRLAWTGAHVTGPAADHLAARTRGIDRDFVGAGLLR